MDPSTAPLQVPLDEGLVGGAAILIALLWIGFAILFIAVVAFIVFTAVRRYRAAKDAGLDPFAGDIQVMGKVKDSAVLAPERSVTDRLAEVDALHDAGTISTEEHAAARQRILGEV